MNRKNLKVSSSFKAFSLVVLSIIFISSCKNKNVKIKDVDILHQNEDQLTKIIIYDVFTPPVASRIYAYSSLAAYETLRNKDPKAVSFTDRLNGFAPMPKPEKGKDYNYTFAATKAFFAVVHKMVFSLDSLTAYENKVDLQFKDELSPEVYERSVAFGDSIGKTILIRANADGYIKSRGKARYLGSNLPGKWRPTAPDYSDAVEWCWNDIKTLAIDRNFLEKNLLKPVPYSLDPKSAYYKQLDSVYHLTKNLSQEQKEIATFWDDNPFTVQHSGHMMFGNKKITPGGHWMYIASIACKKTHVDLLKTAQVYAATSISLFDGFIGCWNLKYIYSTVRPITLINEYIDKDWNPMLQTPPFPEYPSAHSTITRSTAIVLSHFFGNNFEFEDTSEMKYIGMKRKFKSFLQAADEASISRVYGGIHYKYSVDQGAEEGKKIGNIIVKKLDIGREEK
ncbi:hypothetical protein ABIB40_002734 [Pedobacter sp. UYP30]|uniref:vanadium-dependent haloperoxidase n=1 Tax=Pedobacter sp. UYP30 TaxID=1756400 RepID=UPI003395ECBD